MLTRHGDNGPVVSALAAGSALAPTIERDRLERAGLSAAALSNDVHVSAAKQSNGRVDPPPAGSSVLANLPKTRPQRSSARRAAARGTGTSAPAATDAPDASAPPAPAVPARTPKAAAKPRRAKTGSAGPKSTGKRAAAKPSPRPRVGRKTGRPELPPVPRQGYASEGDRATGAVQAPGGTELAGSAVEIIGELAKAGLSTGERLLRDVLSRLPGS
jgi:hypothetical protein